MKNLSHTLPCQLPRWNAVSAKALRAVLLDICESAHRITVAHHNVPNMIAGITAVLAKDDINIANMTNKNKGQFAYTMIDVDSEVTGQAIADLKAIEGVTRVRLVK